MDWKDVELERYSGQTIIADLSLPSEPVDVGIVRGEWIREDEEGNLKAFYFTHIKTKAQQNNLLRKNAKPTTRCILYDCLLRFTFGKIYFSYWFNIHFF